MEKRIKTYNLCTSMQFLANFLFEQYLNVIEKIDLICNYCICNSFYETKHCKNKFI